MADDPSRRPTGSTCRSHPFGWERALRVRIRFQKLGKVRFVGHRDVARIFERALRKVGFPVTYSEGFSPRVKLSFGLALPT
ncbi:MAG: TIGR03936 family radical SAM-associated protein, partial [Actinomycetota bacterium]|nr:TIGR03936 family radical SAM-associated protein [Actinomycetota bacterium]